MKSNFNLYLPRQFLTLLNDSIKLKKRNTNIVFITLMLIAATSTCIAKSPSFVLDKVISDYRQKLSANWGPHKLTEYFSPQNENYTYLATTFGSSVLSESINIKSRFINLSEDVVADGGYDLLLVLLEYPNSSISDSNFKKIIQSPNKNLKGGKIFMGYTALQCDAQIILISSPAIATREIKTYFNDFTISRQLCPH
jgi:hypothetical protein